MRCWRAGKRLGETLACGGEQLSAGITRGRIVTGLHGEHLQHHGGLRLLLILQPAAHETVTHALHELLIGDFLRLAMLIKVGEP